PSRLARYSADSLVRFVWRNVPSIVSCTICARRISQGMTVDPLMIHSELYPAGRALSAGTSDCKAGEVAGRGRRSDSSLGIGDPDRVSARPQRANAISAPPCAFV